MPLYKVLACLISSAFGSMAGICYFYHMAHVGPEIFSIMASFNVVTMGLAGGVGTLYGAALGGAGLSLLLELMRPIALYRSICYAGLLVLVVMLFSKGVWGGLTTLWQRIKVHERAIDEKGKRGG